MTLANDGYVYYPPYLRGFVNRLGCTQLLYGETDGPAYINNSLCLIGKKGRLKHSKLDFEVVATLTKEGTTLVMIKVTGGAQSDWIPEDELRSMTTSDWIK